MVRYPWKRVELGAYLQELADPLFQWQAWIERKHDNSGEMQGFDFSAHFILDEMTLHENAENCLGIILKTPEEVITLTVLGKALIAVIEAVGKMASDREYLVHPLWKDVVLSARKALDAFCEAEYGFPVTS